MASLGPPAPPLYTSADFARAFLRLLPSGRVWPRERGAVLPMVAAGLAPTYARMSDRAAALLQDAPAGNLLEQLPEWEATLNLPDPCAGSEPTFDLRRAQVRAKIAAIGGQSVPYFISIAATLGYTIQVREFAPARYGFARYGDRIYGSDWANAWQVTQVSGGLRTAQYGSARYGERYRSWGNRVLECQLQAIKPAHTVLAFTYADPGQPL